MFTITSIGIASLAVSATRAAEDTKTDSDSASAKLTTQQVERHIAAVYDRAGQALVRVEGEGGKFNGGEAGIVVTADGHVVYRPISGGVKRTFRMADGRRVTGKHLGWSREWGVGLAKLDGPGPWAHVQLADSAGVKSGQAVVTLGYSDRESLDIVPRALLDVKRVTGSAVGRWFVLADAQTARWRNAPAVFDLDGRLVGVGWFRLPGGVGFGTVYTDAKMVRVLWDDLTTGKNVDETRLHGGKRKDSGAQNRTAKNAITADVEQKAKAASVRIWDHITGRGQFRSGTIVSPEGTVATCAHALEFVMPGKRFTVCLPNGRDAAATLLGLNHVCDICLLKITDKGPWPHVDIGDSTWLRPGDPCLFIGYGPVKGENRQPDVRTSSVAERWSSHWDHQLDTESGTVFVGGDSGGGVFDADGRLVAMHGVVGEKGTIPHRNMRVELFRAHRDELTGPYEETRASLVTDAEADLSRAAARARPWVVEVLDGDKAVALGAVVGREGRILTQSSALPDAPSCRLASGRVLPAKVVKTSREHDLAILRVEAADLPVVDWSKGGDPPAGTPVVVAGAGKEVPTGCVSHPAVAIPPEEGFVGARLVDAAKGLEVAEVYEEAGASPLRKGDVVLSYDGHPVPDLKTYLGLPSTGPDVPVAGDRAAVIVERERKKIELRPVLRPRVNKPDGQSPRCSGFGQVYGVLAAGESTLLGGPVLDFQGRSVGVAIAWRARGWLLVLPAAAARAVSGD